MQNNRLLKLKDVVEITGRSAASIYRDMGLGTFPKPLELGPNSVRWTDQVIENWLNTRPTRTIARCGRQNR